MKLSFLATREISSKPGAVMRQLHHEGALIITDHGKPRALLLPISEESFLDDVGDLLSWRANRALKNIRRRAAASGLDKLTDEEIDAEIAAVRRTRKARE